MNLRDAATIEERRQMLERELGVSLTHTGSFTLDGQVAASRHCENMVGVVQVPLGVAGPIAVNGMKGGVYVPLATTEGALVASVNRGARAITASGGADVATELVGATRGPVFETRSLAASQRLAAFIRAHGTDLDRTAKTTSSHISLLGSDVRVVGRYVFVRFSFATGDAMGMNMVSVATTAMAGYIETETGVPPLAVAGNYDIDKKPAWLNVIGGRGRSVWAEVELPESVVRDVLKTTPQAMYGVWVGKCMVGSTAAGSLGFNAHVANVVAALYLATGQDIAHVTEGSCATTTTHLVPAADGTTSLAVSLTMPDVMVGSVGGGTGLATQREALAMLGVSGDDGADRLARIVGAAALAGEVSLLASLAEGSLARAHQRLARGKK